MITARAAFTGLLRAATIAVAAGFVLPASAASTWVVHDADEILSRFTVGSEGRLDFVDVQGSRWELINRIDDPEITNRGSGSFHPASEEVVREALRDIEARGFPLDGLHVYLLPFPRRGLMPSSATRDAIYLSPGVVPFRSEPIHALVAHEAGHVIHQRYLPDGDLNGWKVYRHIRGIEDQTIYHDGARHADRPHEIFAEDFRVLFGGDLANYSGGIENPDLVHPSLVPGLLDFMAGLAGESPARETTPLSAAYPNPFRTSTTIRMSLSPERKTAVLDIVDAAGRHVRRIPDTEISGGNLTARWDGRDERGRLVPAGVYFARLPGDPFRSTTRIIRAR
jgi:hypothetical protein